MVHRFINIDILVGKKILEKASKEVPIMPDIIVS